MLRPFLMTSPTRLRANLQLKRSPVHKVCFEIPLAHKRKRSLTSCRGCRSDRHLRLGIGRDRCPGTRESGVRRRDECHWYRGNEQEVILFRNLALMGFWFKGNRLNDETVVSTYRWTWPMYYYDARVAVAGFLDFVPIFCFFSKTLHPPCTGPPTKHATCSHRVRWKQ